MFSGSAGLYVSSWVRRWRRKLYKRWHAGRVSVSSFLFLFSILLHLFRNLNRAQTRQLNLTYFLKLTVEKLTWDFQPVAFLLSSPISFNGQDLQHHWLPNTACSEGSWIRIVNRQQQFFSFLFFALWWSCYIDCNLI